ncbi:MAG: hypothetical protein HW403_243 [Dehalococcoidia bacterium]|nr:hypothetical protein [Dehalococcoidia bacterium]
MKRISTRITEWVLPVGVGLASLVLMGVLSACTATQPEAGPSAPITFPSEDQASSLKDVPSIGALPGGVAPGGAPAPAPATSPSGGAPAPAAALKLLKTSPDKGYVGDSFTMTGEGLPSGKEVEFAWVTVDGGYTTVVGPENVEFHEKTFEPKRVSLGRFPINAEGRLSASLKAPDDYGEVHDIFAVVDGQDVAKGGYRIMRNATISPTEGPVGTPITIKVTGLGWKTFESTIGVRYDNQPTGLVTAVTTRGIAEFQIRATGAPGKRVIDLNHAARSTPYLNNQQSGTAHISDLRLWFTVTKDSGPPPFTIEWPEDGRLAKAADLAVKTASGGVVAAPGFSAVMDPPSGPILSQATVQARGLSANSVVELFWITVKGNRTIVSGWGTTETSLLKKTTSADGSLTASVQIPDDLGGWHTIKLVQGEKVVGEVPYFVERSIVGITPMRVKAGETFNIQIKGVGWTELDNGVAITYDNSFIGFACGFNSQGDVTVPLVATGEPGTHLIDLYPMIYQGHGKPPWSYQWPILTYRQDAPGLALGYRLPAIRLAITVVE